MPESKRKLDLICDLFTDDGQTPSWVRLSQLCAESDRRNLNLEHALITQYVRRYCINDPSNQSPPVKNFVNAPRFVTADPRQRDDNRRYRLLSLAERAAFQVSRRSDWHMRPYSELEAQLRPQAPAHSKKTPQRPLLKTRQEPRTNAVQTVPAAEPKTGRVAKPAATRKKQMLAIVDVSNLTREELDERGHAKLAVLKNLLDKLDAGGVKTIAIADASLQAQIDDEAAFRDYCRRGLIKQSPSRTEADGWILELANEMAAYIISRDTFRERIEKYPALRSRLISFMVFDGAVMLDPEHPFTKAIKESRKKR
jgi:hypothetical protein